MRNYLDAVISMQIYNYYGKYNKAKSIYEKYEDIFPEDIYLKNKILNEYEISTGQFVLKSKPRNLQIVLFDVCQNNCIMCTQKNKKYNYFLPEKYIYEITDLLPYLDTILWQGGEIFLWDRFIDFLQIVSNYKRITQSIITNFQYIEREEIIKLINIHNIKLIISIDGAKKNTYEKIRKGSSYSRLLKNIRLLNTLKEKYNSNISLHINFVILKENYQEINEIINFAKEYKFESVSFIKCTATPDYDNNFDSSVKFEIEKNLKFAVINAVKKNIAISIQYPSKLSDLIRNRNITSGNMICKFPWYKLLLAEDYNFAPECSCFKRQTYNEQNICIQDMWNSKLMQDYRKHIMSIQQKKKICNHDCLFYGSYYFENMPAVSLNYLGYK
ncbi:MAG: radical SAM protein [Endomicrobiaceae bacterium]